MHNLCGIRVFAGIPVAGVASAATAARSAGPPLGLLLSRIEHGDGGHFLLVGAALKGQSASEPKAGSSSASRSRPESDNHPQVVRIKPLGLKFDPVEFWPW
jgi:hypothetical protein